MGVSKTHEQFIKEVEELVGNGYSVLGTYKKAHDKIEVKHNECGYVYYVRASAFLYGTRCPKCANNIKRTTEDFKNKIYELVGDEYTLKSEYISNRKKVTLLHNVCNNEYQVTPGHFLTTGRRCPYCRGGVLVKGYDFNKEVVTMTNGEYSVIGEYKNNKTHIEMLHNICGTKWKIRPDNFKSGKRCPNCNQSHGEKEIERILKSNKIKYKVQYRFNDCKNQKPLPFDFAIIKKDKVVQLVEYQGEQHYKVVDYFGGEKGFQRRIRNDKIKKNYCKKKNIPLLIIDYCDNIQDKLNTMAIMSQA